MGRHSAPETETTTTYIADLVARFLLAPGDWRDRDPVEWLTIIESLCAEIYPAYVNPPHLAVLSGKLALDEWDKQFDAARDRRDMPYVGKHRLDEEAEELHRDLQVAANLLGDGDGSDWEANPEYSRAIFEFLADKLDVYKDDVPQLLRNSRGLNAEALRWWFHFAQDGRR
jgi:hypothetical protein